MNERTFIRDYGLTQTVAAELALAISRYTSRPASTSDADRKERRARLPNIVGTLRIEGLALSCEDRQFFDDVIELGLNEADTLKVTAAYLKAKQDSKLLANVPAE
jgi:hypothetical protein